MVGRPGENAFPCSYLYEYIGRKGQFPLLQIDLILLEELVHSSFHSSFLGVSYTGEQFLGSDDLFCTCVQPVMLVLPVQLQTQHLSSNHDCWCWCVTVSSLGFLLQPGASSQREQLLWVVVFQVLSWGRWTFFPRALHSLSGFLRIDISVMWLFHKFWKSVLWKIFLRSWLFLLVSLNLLRCGLALDIADEAVPLTDTVAWACSLHQLFPYTPEQLVQLSLAQGSMNSQVSLGFEYSGTEVWAKHVTTVRQKEVPRCSWKNVREQALKRELMHFVVTLWYGWQVPGLCSVLTGRCCII